MGQPSDIISYWQSLIELVTHPKTAVEKVDVPLPAAATQAKWNSGWTVLCFWLTILVVHGKQLPHTADSLFGSPLPGIVAWLSFLLCGMIAVPLTYGFLRLYTLVTHVLTLNVFKVRGQRLRLLNLETKLLPLSVFVCIGCLLVQLNRFAGLTFIAAVALFAM